MNVHVSPQPTASPAFNSDSILAQQESATDAVARRDEIARIIDPQAMSLSHKFVDRPDMALTAEMKGRIIAAREKANAITASLTSTKLIGRPAFLEKALAELPADEAVLIPLYEGYRAIDEALTGVRNKPRCQTPASGLIEDEQERARNYTNAIIVKLSQLTSIKSFWTELYLDTMLSHNFYTGGGATEALEVIAAFNALRVVEPASH